MARDPKRQQRKREAARTRSGSPYKRIGQIGPVEACYINAGWREDSMASAWVLRRAPDGGHALAAFLIDRWCIGLKDAWGQLDISYADWTDILDQRRALIALERVDLDLVRQLVSGAIEFSERHGFRLPPRYERWVALLGPLPPGPEAVHLLGTPDGKLRYNGALEDLARRLTRERLDQFLSRPDVECAFVDPELLGHDPEQDKFEADLAEADEEMTRKLRQFCYSRGVVPHPRLREAWQLLTEAMLQTRDIDPDGLDEAMMTRVTENLERLLALGPPDEAAELAEAVAQIQECMAQFDTVEDLGQELSLDWLADERSTSGGAGRRRRRRRKP